jgi:Predicted alternative tryptophan synthase beta-subunit (paralog of TrpB)
VSENRWIRIPEEVLEVYRLYRPTPFIRAERLEKALKTTAKIFYKYEALAHPQS